MAYPNPRFGETTEIGCTFTERDGTAFTISSATVTIKTADGTGTRRSAVSATVSGANVYYIEAFSLANGYVAGTLYKATFAATIAVGGTTYVEKHEDTFLLLSGQ